MNRVTYIAKDAKSNEFYLRSARLTRPHGMMIGVCFRVRSDGILVYYAGGSRQGLRTS